MPETRKPTVAFFDFAGCEGCQIEFTNYGDPVFLELLKHVDVVEFREAMSEKTTEPIDVAFIEGSFSREADRPVLLEFRTCADPQNPGPWRQLPMGRIEKLYSFARKLDSVSEDVQYRVSAGEFVS